ncbi:short-chain-fatty-acid--CoA ligase (acyl-CoA synthetase) [Escherichia coli]|uniref:Short-chain-fatty-acid--CoA ligase (Acyl-CoA synthetase) n=1 Tax=Escherichia coli TaxID=562 RepID=A0A377D5T5_ECOLX|nr:short-chain-fatty-acid--CoA ligase (acyl-CoA synthetase) [Escherichia coli]
MKVTLTFNEQRRAAYRQQGLWGDASLADYWQQTARAMPDKIAVVDNHGASYTYSALDPRRELSGKLDVSEGY